MSCYKVANTELPVSEGGKEWVISNAAEGHLLATGPKLKKGREIPQEFSLISPAEKIRTQLRNPSSPCRHHQEMEFSKEA